jgi:hypothetical protein
MRRRLRDSVVVITGASSGIGRAAALAFTRVRQHREFVNIGQLRSKIDKGFDPPLILTRWGEGYLLRGDQD